MRPCGRCPTCPWNALLKKLYRRNIRFSEIVPRMGAREGQVVPPHHRHKIQPGYRCGRVIRSAPKRLPPGDSQVYGQESCPQPENDHREDEKTAPINLKGVSEKAVRPAVVGRLPARERKTLLAIARVLTG